MLMGRFFCVCMRFVRIYRNIVIFGGREMILLLVNEYDFKKYIL